MDKKEWNLGDGLPNVCESVMRKLDGAGWRLENGPRTILNVDSYEVTVMYRAMQEYMEKKYVQNIRVETTSNVQDKKLEVGQDGNSIYKVSGVELPKMLADGEETIPAIVGDYVAQQFSSRASQEGSYNYSTTGRSYR